jgi:hypothetical protein
LKKGENKTNKAIQHVRSPKFSGLDGSSCSNGGYLWVLGPYIMFRLFHIRGMYCIHLHGDKIGAGGSGSDVVEENVLVKYNILREFGQSELWKG